MTGAEIAAAFLWGAVTPSRIKKVARLLTSEAMLREFVAALPEEQRAGVETALRQLVRF